MCYDAPPLLTQARSAAPPYIRYCGKVGTNSYTGVIQLSILHSLAVYRPVLFSAEQIIPNVFYHRKFENFPNMSVKILAAMPRTGLKRYLNVKFWPFHCTTSSGPLDGGTVDWPGNDGGLGGARVTDGIIRVRTLTTRLYIK